MKTFYYSFLKACAFFALLFLNLNLLGQVGIKDCAIGFHHNLFIGYNDSLYLFGENADGQCGDGSTSNVLTTKAANVKAIAVACGFNYSFYIKTDSTIMASGKNAKGELGIGNTNTKNTWTAVNLASTIHFKQIAASSDHTLALTTTGLVYGWGANKKGEVGDNTTTQKNSPVLVLKAVGVNLTGVVKVAAGSPDDDNNTGGHSLALASDGTVWAWGLNSSGQLGNGTTGNKSMAVQVVGVNGVGFLTGVLDIAVSGNSSYALMADSTVVSWGGNADGQLGDGSTTGRTTPNYVKINATTNLTSVKQISASATAKGDDFLAVLKSNGKIWNVGANSKGQLGTGNVTAQTYVVENTPLLNRTYLKVIATGHYQVQLSADTLGNYCESGHQTNGSFGDGSAANTNISSATCLSVPIASLPVALSSFAAKRTDNKVVVLRWSTESEISNDHFEIEYSTDGTEFETIGSVKGMGTSFTSNSYQFIQKDAANAKTCYYRLKQIDFNGGYEYHKIIAVKSGVEAGNTYAYPNPTKGTMSVTITDETNTDYSISIMDQTGRIVMEKTGYKAANLISEKFDLNGFDSGLYFVTIKTSFGTKIEKILKQ